MSESILVQCNDGVMTITINRPERRNAVTRSCAERVAAALDQLDTSADLRVAIINGAGGFFSAGMDLKVFRETGERPRLPGRGFLGLSDQPPAKPLIAAVEGFAIGGGFEVVLACDLLVAARGAYFALPEVCRGLVAASGGLLRLPHLLPPNLAREMVFTGEPMTAETAHMHGLVNRLVEPGKALAEAQILARKILLAGPLAVSVSKQVMQESASWPSDMMFQRQAVIVDAIFQSADAQEGALAFAERREPIWKAK